MAEWNPEKRKALYACLGDLDLSGAREIVAPCKSLKISDFAPKDKTATARLIRAVPGDEPLQASILDLVFDPNPSAQILGHYIFKILGAFPGKPFSERIVREMSELDGAIKRVLEGDQRTSYKGIPVIGSERMDDGFGEVASISRALSSHLDAVLIAAGRCPSLEVAGAIRKVTSRVAQVLSSPLRRKALDAAQFRRAPPKSAPNADSAADRKTDTNPMNVVSPQAVQATAPRETAPLPPPQQEGKACPASKLDEAAIQQLIYDANADAALQDRVLDLVFDNDPGTQEVGLRCLREIKDLSASRLIERLKSSLAPIDDTIQKAMEQARASALKETQGAYSEGWDAGVDWSIHVQLTPQTRAYVNHMIQAAAISSSREVFVYLEQLPRRITRFFPWDYHEKRKTILQPEDARDSGASFTLQMAKCAQADKEECVAADEDSILIGNLSNAYKPFLGGSRDCNQSSAKTALKHALRDFWDGISGELLAKIHKHHRLGKAMYRIAGDLGEALQKHCSPDVLHQKISTLSDAPEAAEPYAREFLKRLGERFDSAAVRANPLLDLTRTYSVGPVTAMTVSQAFTRALKESQYEDVSPIRKELSPLDGCGDYEEYRRRLSELGWIEMDGRAPTAGETAEPDWARLSQELRHIVCHRLSFELLESECLPRFQPRWLNAVRALASADTGDPVRKNKRISGIVSVYFVCAREPDPSMEEFLRKGPCAAVEDVWDRVFRFIDSLGIAKSWWAPHVVAVHDAVFKHNQGGKTGEPEKQVWRGYKYLIRLAVNGVSGPLDEVFGLLNSSRTQEAASDPMAEAFSRIPMREDRSLAKLYWADRVGMRECRFLLRDPQFYDIGDILATLPDDLVRYHLEGWDSYNPDRPGTVQQSTLQHYLDRPGFADVVAARLVACLESGIPEYIDWAFRIAFEKPERLAPSGRDLVELTALGLWQQKTLDAKAAILRLHALGEFDRCTGSRAAAAIEEAFSTENPTLWRAAAEAIVALRKKDKTIRLQNPNRVKELIDRDPEKFKKPLGKLLD